MIGASRTTQTTNKQNYTNISSNTSKFYWFNNRRHVERSKKRRKEQIDNGQSLSLDRTWSWLVSLVSSCIQQRLKPLNAGHLSKKPDRHVASNCFHLSKFHIFILRPTLPPDLLILVRGLQPRDGDTDIWLWTAASGICSRQSPCTHIAD